MLSPKIREGEPFEMTIESGDIAYTFVGHLNSTEINFERDAIEIEPDLNWNRQYIPGQTTYNISLEIVAGSMTRTNIPRKKAKNVQ